MPWKRRPKSVPKQTPFFFSPSPRHSALLSKCFPGLARPPNSVHSLGGEPGAWAARMAQQPHSPAPLRQLHIQQAARHRQVTPRSWITAANDSGGEAATAGFQGDVALNRQLQAERTLPDTRPPSPTLGPPGDSRRRSLDPMGTRVSTVFITT